MVCVSKASFATLVGVGGGGRLFTDDACFTESSCNKPCVANDEGKSFNSGEKEGTARKRRVDVKRDSVAVETVGEGVDTQAVVFKSMGKILIFTPDGDVRFPFMLIGRLCLEVVSLETGLLLFK